MKYLKVEVTRTASTDLYIQVPDDFDIKTIQKRKTDIERIAKETTTSDDWDNFEWEKTIEIQSVIAIGESDAKEYPLGVIES